MTDGGGAFGVRLGAWRRLAGVTQEELAERSGLSIRAVSNLERGRTRWPRPDSVRRLADALGLRGEQRGEFIAAARRRLARGADAAVTAMPVHPVAFAAPGGGVRFGLLGPLQVVDGAGAVWVVPAAKQRIVLAAMLLAGGRAVSVAGLAEALWDASPPPNAPAVIRTYVARLRRALGPAGARIVGQAPGWAVDLHGPEELDVTEVDGLWRAARAAGEAGEWRRVSSLLARALGLWRGEPLADVPSDALSRREAGRLAELRLQLTEARIDADLRLSRHGEVMAELRRLTAEHPLRERLRAQLMLACYRCGHQAAALEVYRDARSTLAQELGVEPGPELRQMHQKILAADPGLTVGKPAPGQALPGQLPVGQAKFNGHGGELEMPAGLLDGEAGGAARQDGGRAAGLPPGVPRQLPAPVRDFVGRAGELERLSALAQEAAGVGSAVVISAIGGTAGVGKTALAVRSAHQVAGLFPDGQLYADLRGFSPSGEPVPPGRVMRGFLNALGVAPQAVPADADAQAGLYRSMLAGRRVLVVLDNARDAAQVRPLVPGSVGCLVMVTSRRQLTGLAATGEARLLDLGLLTEGEARELLAGRLGAGRVAAEPDAVDELIRVCARLPLALAITAARAAARPAHKLAALAAELRTAGGPLDALDAGEPAASVRTVFSWSNEQLSPAAARLFRLLGIHPGPDISAPAAASLAAVEPAQARYLLAELARAHLVAEHAPGRYAFHDLLRAYAAEQAHVVDSASFRRAATGRVLGHYLNTAYAAAVLVNPSRKSRIVAPPQPGVTSEQPADYRQALAWFEAEHHVLLAVAALAAEAGFDRHAWQLPWAIWDYLNFRGQWPELAALQRSALDAATRLGDTGGQAATHRAIAGAYAQLASYDLAHAHLTDSLKLYRQLGDRTGQARVYLSMASVSDSQERYDDALGHSEQALRLFQAIGDRVGQARALASSGWCCAHLGRHQQARDFCQQSLALLRGLGHRLYEAETWVNLGYAEHQCGDHAAAAACYQRSLGLFRELGDRHSQATVLIHLGDAQHAAGQAQAARRAWREAVAILDTLHHPDAEKVRAKLRKDGSGQDPGPAGRNGHGDARMTREVG